MIAARGSRKFYCDFRDWICTNHFDNLNADQWKTIMEEDESFPYDETIQVELGAVSEGSEIVDEPLEQGNVEIESSYNLPAVADFDCESYVP